MRKIFSISLVLVFLYSLNLFAFKQNTSQTEFDNFLYKAPYLRVVKSAAKLEEISGKIPNLSAYQSLLSDLGTNWQVWIDERTGRISHIEGGAIPWIPGAANNLSWDEFGSICQGNDCIPYLESKARAFLQKYENVFGLSKFTLLLDKDGSVQVGSSIYFLRFQAYYYDIPVEGGSVYFIINNGNFIQVSMEYLGKINVNTNPSFPPSDSWLILNNYLNGTLNPKDEVLQNAEISIIPITPKEIDPNNFTGNFGSGIDYILVYNLKFKREGVMGTWGAKIDALTGEVVEFLDYNRYGLIKGGIYKTDVNHTQVEEVMPFPYADYGTGVFADISGSFPGTSGTCTMTGRTGSAGNVGSVKIVDTCGSISLASDAQGTIDFGTSGGTDCTTPGFGGAGNTHSSRTQYWNVAQIKIKAYTYLNGNTWLQGLLTDKVNLNQTCNAYWDGTAVNFFKSSSNCRNTGELPGVSLHEWGHGMDDFDGSGGDSPPVETRADWTAILQTHQSCAGGGFFKGWNMGCGTVPSGYNCDGYGDCCTNCSGIRDADYAKHASNTPWTAVNHGTVWNCGGGWYNGPCGWEDHCESGISTQALWDFAVRDLPTTCGMEQNSAWQLVDRLFYSSMPQLGNMYTCTPPNSNGCTGNTLYNLFRAIDDDGDGTANGTPHAACIYAALARHNIACGNASDPTNQNQTSCPSLSTPTLSGVAGSNSANLSWNTITNATRYFIYRNETSCDSGFTKIGTVNAPNTNYTDTPLVNGITYYYRIQAATANDSCVSFMSNCITVTPQPCAGSVTLSKSIFNCNDSGTITVLDSTAPASPFNVEIWSTTDGTHRTVQVSGSPSTYTGTFTTTTGTPGANQVKVSNGDTIYVRYVDPDYCGSPNVNVDITASVDCQGPVISNVRAENVTGSKADIKWDTNELSDSTVIYGTSTPPSGSSAYVSTLTTSHTVPLSGLTECTNYYYYVKSKDAASNETTANNGGSYYTFTTGVNVQPTYNSTDVPKTIPDPGTVTSNINVPDNKIIQKVIVTIGNITHTWDADLDIYLIAPDNTRVELSTDNGSTGDNYINTVFDDDATTSITAGSAPFTGTFKPEGSLAALIGKNASGVWKLEVTDDAGSDSGTLNSWSLTLYYPPQGCGPSLEYQSSVFTDTCNGTGSGNNDGIIDAGEDVLLQITLHNNGTAGTTGISATISTTTTGVTITDNNGTFPNIPQDGTGTSQPDHFSFRVDPSVSCGTTINFNIHMLSNENPTGWDDTFSLTVGQWVGGTSTTLWSESYDGTTFPPTGWDQVDVSGTAGNWARSTNTVHPAGGGTHSGAGLAYFNSFSVSAGSSTRLFQTSGTTIPATSASAEFVIWMYHDTGFSTDNDRIQVQVSLNGTTWTDLGSAIPRYDGSIGWKKHTIDMTSYIGQSIRIGILGISGYGNDCHIDDVSLTYTTPLACQMNACTPAGGCTANLGDPSENGTISAMDASLILQYVSGLITFTPSQQCRADVNESTSVTAMDASYTLQCTAGLCSSLPSNFNTSCQAHGNCP